MAGKWAPLWWYMLLMLVVVWPGTRHAGAAPPPAPAAAGLPVSSLPMAAPDVLACLAVGLPPFVSSFPVTGSFLVVEASAITAAITGQCFFELRGSPASPVGLSNLQVPPQHPASLRGSARPTWASPAFTGLSSSA